MVGTVTYLEDLDKGMLSLEYQSCFILRKIKRTGKGFSIVTVINQNRITRVAIVWVNDTEFFANSPNTESDIQYIINAYVIYYEATGARVK